MPTPEPQQCPVVMCRLTRSERLYPLLPAAAGVSTLWCTAFGAASSSGRAPVSQTGGARFKSAAVHALCINVLPLSPSGRWLRTFNPTRETADVGSNPTGGTPNPASAERPGAS